MLREIIKTNSEKYILHIPKKYLNKKIEILVLPFENETKNEYQDISFQNAIKKTAGILKSRKIDPVKWQKDIRSEWE
ncbi:MAG: hypothetical protein KAI40_01255 [Desulfobacterales bacterium]|nr:hypothetical protein [Desulfobacterales bacterium]